jgi:hypothetical protein
VKKSAGISKLIALATTKIPKPTQINTTGINKISDRDVKTFVEIVQKLVEKVKDIDVKFLNKGLARVVTGLQGKVPENSKSNTTKMMYMYKASMLSNNFKNLVKPGANGKFTYNVEAANLPKISKMNAILNTINLTKLTNDNISELLSTAQVPPPQEAIKNLVKKAENVTNQPFQSTKGRRNYENALKKLENTRNRGGNNGNRGNNGNTAAVPVVPVTGAERRNMNVPMAPGAGGNSANAAMNEAANALSEQNAQNIKNLLQTNKSPQNILTAIRLVEENNKRLKKTVWNASTNKLKTLRNYELFTNNLNKLTSAQSLSTDAINNNTAALRKANKAAETALITEGSSPELETAANINAEIAIGNAQRAGELVNQNPTAMNNQAAKAANETAVNADNIARAANRITPK